MLQKGSGVMKKVTGTATPMPKGVGVGVITSLLMALFLCACLSWLALKSFLPEHMLGYAVMITLLISSAIGAGVAADQIKRRMMMVCLLTGVFFAMVLAVLTAILFGGQYQGIITSVIVIMLGSGCIGLLKMKSRGGRKLRRLKTKTC